MQERLQRVPFTRPVYLSIPGAAQGAPEEPRKLVAGNLSRGGMFIRGDAELEPGSRVALSLEAQGQVLPFAEAEVIWTCDGTTPGPHGDATPGSGVRFTRFLHPRSTELLGYLVSRRAAAGAPKVTAAQPEPLAATAASVPFEPPQTLVEPTQDREHGNAPAPVAPSLSLELPDQLPAIAAAPSDAVRGQEPVFERSLPLDEPGAIATTRPLLLTQPVSVPANLREDDAAPLAQPPAPSVPTNIGPGSVPPSDFMNRPLADRHAREDESPAPRWVTQMDVAGESAATSAVGSHEIRSDWFEQGEQAPTSGLHPINEARRLGTSLALLAVLVLVAGGLIWLLRHQGTVESADVDAPVGVTGPTGETIAPQSAPVSATEPTPAPLPPSAQPVVAAASAASATAPAAALEKAGTRAPAAPAEPTQVARAEPTSNTAAPATQKRSRSQRHVFRSGAVQAVAVSSSGKEVFAALELPAGASIERVFVLRSPARVVVDVRGASPRRSAKISTRGSMIQGLRVGARSGGTRLVIDMKRPVARATANGRTVEVVLR